MLPSGLFATRYEADMAILRTRTQWFVLAAAIAFLYAVPSFLGDYWVTWATSLSVIVLAVLGLHILTGLCGVFSIGQAAFMGVGAYTTAILAGRYDVPGLVCLPIAALAAGVVGVFFGLPSFRLKGFYIAIASLAANFIILWIIRYFADWTGGGNGMALAPLSVGGFAFKSRMSIYMVAITLMLVGTFFAKNLQRMPVGRAFVAIRDNELAAEVGGISIFRYKMLAFFIGCMYAGVAGWLSAYSQFWITPDHYQINNSIWYFGMLAIGGMGSTAGVFLGVGFLKSLEMIIDEVTKRADIADLNVALSLVGFSVVILAFLILEPGGLYSRWLKFKTYYRLRPYSYRGG
jgi:branched-chain amino acid transport system permease protein